ncbi:MAG: RpiB/LacA/LacB family sugar-phosphate isomerase, partial [Thermoguttaceae bacterium]|nr:RpiB/LacA/LacB family sugar-phosphate isomerase [Thermoguttaceae bacterium]
AETASEASDEFTPSEKLIVVETARKLAATTDAKIWRLAPRTVVTPAAKDELRKLGVRLEFDAAPCAAAPVGGAPESESASKRAIVAAIHLPNGGVFPKFVEDYLNRNYEYDALHLDCLKETTKQIAARIAENKETRVILTTRDAAIAGIWANRKSGVRAVVAFGVEQARRDLAAADANVVVVDPRDVGPYPFRQIVEIFLQR